MEPEEVVRGLLSEEVEEKLKAVARLVVEACALLASSERVTKEMVTNKGALVLALAVQRCVVL